MLGFCVTVTAMSDLQLPTLQFPLSPLVAGLVDEQLRRKPLPSQEILSILDLLDKAENDVISEVQRVKDGIKETRVMIDDYRHYKKLKNKENVAGIAIQKRDTRRVDGDFWLSM
jgi:hypothetical protein